MVSQYKNQVDGLMASELSRGAFLKFVGAAMLGVVGVVGFFKNLHTFAGDHKSGNKGRGYGRSIYGR